MKTTPPLDSALQTEPGSGGILVQTQVLLQRCTLMGTFQAALIYVPATLFGIGWIKDATAVRRRGDARPRLRIEAGSLEKTPDLRLWLHPHPGGVGVFLRLIWAELQRRFDQHLPHDAIPKTR